MKKTYIVPQTTATPLGAAEAFMEFSKIDIKTEEVDASESYSREEKGPWDVTW